MGSGMSQQASQHVARLSHLPHLLLPGISQLRPQAGQLSLIAAIVQLVAMSVATLALCESLGTSAPAALPLLQLLNL